MSGPEAGYNNIESKERESYLGVQSWGITTSAWPLNPERAFWIVDQINTKRTSQGKDPIRLQVYASPLLTEKRIQKFSRIYSNVPVDSVHAEFNSTIKETVLRAHQEESAIEGVFQIAYIPIFGLAGSGRSVETASLFNQITAKNFPDVKGTGINFHPNVAGYFSQRGEIEKIKQEVYRINVEPERGVTILSLETLASVYGVSSKVFMSNPDILKKFIIKEGFDGMTLPLDHGQGSQSFIKNADVVRALHIADIGHGLVNLEEGSDLRESLAEIFSSYHLLPVTGYFDFNPKIMLGKSEEEQLNIIEENLGKTEDLQKQVLSSQNLQSLHSF